VELCLDNHAVVVTVEDDAREFNPLLHPEVDTTAPLDARAIGGLGVALLRQLMDDVSYARMDGKNILVLKKQIADTQSSRAGD
jgi:serine/threonine-protein kinase RsbW